MAIATGRVLNVLSASDSPSAAETKDHNVLFDSDSTSEYSHTIEVLTKPKVVRAFGLGNGQAVEVLMVAGAGSGTVEENLYLAGSQVTLNPTNNTLVLDISGRYRFKLNGVDPGDVTVLAHDSDVAVTSYGISTLVG